LHRDDQAAIRVSDNIHGGGSPREATPGTTP
jgi:hypothetical protein